MNGELQRRISVIVRRASAGTEDPPSESTMVDVVARKGLEDLVRQVERLEMRLNLILAAIVGTLVVDVLKALVR